MDKAKMERDIKQSVTFHKWTYPCWVELEDIEEDLGNSYETKEELEYSQELPSKVCNCGMKHRPIKIDYTVEIL